MDVQMPVMGGFEATAKIREYERDYGLPRTPIVALTAHAMLGDRERCIQAQMDEYLSKPLKQNQLIQTISKCAALGGTLLERGVSKQDDRRVVAGAVAAVPRPPLDSRANTSSAAVMRPEAASQSDALLSNNLEDATDSRIIFRAYST